MSPLLPLVILALGVGALIIGALPRVRSAGLIAIGAVSAALLALVGLAFFLPSRATLSQWGPASLFPVGLTLEADLLAWLFAAAMLTVTLAALLTGVARPGGRRVVVRGAMLLMAFAGLAAVFADNLLTRVMAWAGLDLIYFLALVVLARSEGLEPQAVLNLSFNSIGTLFALAAAVMISRESETLSLRDAALTSQSTLLITLAAVFRLGLFPLHLGLPAEANIRQGLGVVLRLVPAAVALEMMGRLAVFGFAEAVRPWLTLFGTAAALVGAIQLWSMEDPRQGLTHVIIAQSGLALLAGLVGGALAGVILTAQSLALLLGGALLFLSSGHDERHPRYTVLPVFGALALLGAPLTAGFVGWGGLYDGLLASQNWLALTGVLLAQVILAGGLWRAAFWPGQPVEGEPLVRAAYFAGLIALAGALALGGVLTTIGWLDGPLRPGLLGFSGLSSLAALALVALTGGLGFGLWRFEMVIRGRAETAGGALAALIRLDWLYRLAWGVIRSAGWVIYTLAEVLEGEGAVLWTLVAALLLVLLFT